MAIGLSVLSYSTRSSTPAKVRGIMAKESLHFSLQKLLTKWTYRVALEMQIVSLAVRSYSYRWRQVLCTCG